MEMNKSEFTRFRAALKEAVKGVEEQFDITITPAGIHYGAGKFTLKVEAMLNEVGGVSGAQAEWNRHCRNIGLDESAFGKQVKLSNGMLATITSIHPKRWKRPVGVTTSLGKSYIMEAQKVSRQLSPEGDRNEV